MVRAVFQGIGRLYGRSRWTRLAGDVAVILFFILAIMTTHSLFSLGLLEGMGKEMRVGGVVDLCLFLVTGGGM